MLVLLLPRSAWVVSRPGQMPRPVHVGASRSSANAADVARDERGASGADFAPEAGGEATPARPSDARVYDFADDGTEGCR